MRIYVSGVHSGPDPSSGVGVARSLRVAFPQAALTGVDYSASSSGIHYEGFDDLWVQRPWNEIDLEIYRGQIAQATAEGTAWISCLDLEALWLARNFPEEAKILVPLASALERVAKPSIAAASQLPVVVPAYTSAARPQWDLHAFCRRHGWPVWCKGPVHEARPAWSWPEVLATLTHFREKWALAYPILEAHVQGREESVVFCAYEGELLDCVHMQKCSQTPEGKTWAGAIAEVPASFAEPLRIVLAELKWTGGG
jgi:diaminopimelate decarboxylase